MPMRNAYAGLPSLVVGRASQIPLSERRSPPICVWQIAAVSPENRCRSTSPIDSAPGRQPPNRSGSLPRCRLLIFRRKAAPRHLLPAAFTLRASLGAKLPF